MTITADTSTRRLVNCQVAYVVTNDYGHERIMLGGGADGVPERAMSMAVAADANRHARDFHGERVIGVAITDVRTGERYLWPLEVAS